MATGFIIAPESKSLASCIHCNGSGTSSYGSRTEAEQVMLFKIGLDYINGKEKDGITDLTKLSVLTAREIYA